MKTSRKSLRLGRAPLWVLTLFGIACGVEVGNPKDPDDGNTPKSVWLDDDEAAEASVTAQVDEAFFALAESTTPDNGGTNLTAHESNNSSYLLQDFARTLSCMTEDENRISTAIELSGSRNFTLSRGGRTQSATVSFDDSFTIDHTSPDQGALTCNEAGTLPIFALRKLNELTTTTTFSRSRSRTITVADTGRVLVEGAFQTAGSRIRKTTKVNSFNPLVIRQQISFDINRTSQLSTRQSGTLAYASNLVIPESNPLTITTSYTAGNWTSKTVSLKNYLATLSDGTVITMSFENLILGPKDQCTPESGTIRGEITAPDTSRTRKFTIDFAGGDPELVFENTAGMVFIPDFCASGTD